MKKFLVASIAAAAFISAPAFAEPPAGVFNWTGFYIGVNGGAMDFKTSGDIPGFTPPSTFQTDRKQVGLAGVHGGFQGQWGNWVVGIEGAWHAILGDAYGSKVSSNLSAVGCGIAAALDCQARLNDILTVGPRLGFAMGQWMVYGTGGYARTELDSRFVNRFNGAVVDKAVNPTHPNGWFFGGGMEVFVLSKLILGIEYKHFDFSGTSQLYGASSSDSPTNLKAKADAVLLRLTFK